MQELDHKHILVYAAVKKPPTEPEHVKDWFVRMIDAIDMKVVIPPQVVNLQTPGNEGITGVVTIETSHSSIHVWETAKVPFLHFDLYSCKRFDPDVVMRHIKEFDPYFYEFIVVDRNDSFKIIDRKTEQVTKVIDLLPPEMKELYLESKRIKERSQLSAGHRRAQSEYNKTARLYSGRSTTYAKRRLNSHLSTLVTIKQRSKKQGIDFDLDAGWYEAEFQKAKQQFPNLVPHPSEDCFWGANVDRVDPSKGYTKTNCRIIPKALNVAKWNWNAKELEDLKKIIAYL